MTSPSPPPPMTTVDTIRARRSVVELVVFATIVVPTTATGIGRIAVAAAVVAAEVAAVMTRAALIAPTVAEAAELSHSLSFCALIALWSVWTSGVLAIVPLLGAGSIASYAASAVFTATALAITVMPSAVGDRLMVLAVFGGLFVDGAVRSTGHVAVFRVFCVFCTYWLLTTRVRKLFPPTRDTESGNASTTVVDPDTAFRVTMALDFRVRTIAQLGWALVVDVPFLVALPGLIVAQLYIDRAGATSDPLSTGAWYARRPRLRVVHRHQSPPLSIDDASSMVATMNTGDSPHVVESTVSVPTDNDTSMLVDQSSTERSSSTRQSETTTPTQPEPMTPTNHRLMAIGTDTPSIVQEAAAATANAFVFPTTRSEWRSSSSATSATVPPSSSTSPIDASSVLAHVTRMSNALGLSKSNATTVAAKTRRYRV